MGRKEWRLRLVERKEWEDATVLVERTEWEDATVVVERTFGSASLGHARIGSQKPTFQGGQTRVPGGQKSPFQGGQTWVPGGQAAFIQQGYFTPQS